MASRPPIIEKRVFHKKLLDKRKPDLIDEMNPTVPMRLFNVGRGTATKGVGSAWLMGSKTLTGSPLTQTLQVVMERFNTNTPNVWFAIVHSRRGTVDTPYLESTGESGAIGDLYSPLESFGPGTVKLYALGPGSSKAGRWQGVGSIGAITISGKLLGYLV